MNYNEHKDNPKSFRALTGLTHIQYSHLLPYFEAAHDDYLSEYEMNGKRRTNNPEGVPIIQPVKRSKGKEPSEQEKEYNKEVSRIRVRVEHAIGSAKFMRIVKDECRLRANSFVHNIFATCAALHNMRIKMKPWTYKD